MTADEKVEEIRQYLEKRFPPPDFQVRAAPLDADLLWPFYIDHTRDADLYRRLTIPRAAIEDLFPADIIALLQRSDIEPRWQGLGISPLRLSYNPVVGIDI